ncbi:hypothetical protein CVT24_008849 [Panaeolus cyanescens]|uniref:Peroxidase n=1 Tax=Panaeolus cyanescens TaxID=181874 RepID=A0A409VAU5_9AGAR|nr:hypothetical protein CVT24_008849 [Panaeolus cyanescens]
MKRPSIPLLLSLTSYFSSLTSAYQFPDPKYEALEKLLWEGSRLDGLSLSDSAAGCKHRNGPNSGNVAAEWLRFAFHDAATKNVDDGTGGMDASLFYELDRAENIGVGMKDTANEFLRFAGKYVSRADIVALGTVLGLTSCGGQNIPFKGGRKDAFVAGRPGVPEAHTNLPDTIEAFRKMGFSAPEMVALTTCGHTIGSVRSNDFPDIVPPNPNSNVEVFETFDATGDVFDFKVAKEFVDGVSKNPLVIHPNVTLRSDERIFNLEGGIWMKNLTAAEFGFHIACKFAFLSMIEIPLPAGTQLTEEIKLLSAKVVEPQLTIEKSKLVFKTGFRVRFAFSFAPDITANGNVSQLLTQPVGTTAPANRQVHLFWCDKDGLSPNCRWTMNRAAPVKRSTPGVSPVTTKAGFYFNQYDFVVPIDTLRSIGRYWFVVDNKDGSPVQVYNNGGAFYQVPQDEILYVPRLGKVKGGNKKRVVAAVRFGSIPTDVSVTTYEVAKSPTQKPVVKTTKLAWDLTILPVQGYKFYAADIDFDTNGATLDFTVSLLLGGTHKEDYQSTKLFAQTSGVVKPSSTNLLTANVPQ